MTYLSQSSKSSEIVPYENLTKAKRNQVLGYWREFILLIIICFEINDSFIYMASMFLSCISIIVQIFSIMNSQALPARIWAINGKTPYGSCCVIFTVFHPLILYYKEVFEKCVIEICRQNILKNTMKKGVVISIHSSEL